MIEAEVVQIELKALPIPEAVFTTVGGEKQVIDIQGVFVPVYRITEVGT